MLTKEGRMFKLIRLYNKADKQTKYFILNWVVYGLALILTTAFCYARLDYVRSTKAPMKTEETKQQIKKIEQDAKQTTH